MKGARSTCSHCQQEAEEQVGLLHRPVELEEPTFLWGHWPVPQPTAENSNAEDDALTLLLYAFEGSGWSFVRTVML